MPRLAKAGSFDFELTNRLLSQVQLRVDDGSRRAIADVAAELCRDMLPRRFEGQAGSAAASELRRAGGVFLGPCLSGSQIREIRAFLDRCPLYPGHVLSDRKASRLDERGAHSHACHSILDVLACPHLIELANSDAVLAIAESYLGCAPPLYSLNAFWSYPDPRSLLEGIQTFHRDWDDFRFCTLFIFLTDVAENDGAHQYVLHSHDPDLLRRWLGIAAPGSVAESVFRDLFTRSANLDAIVPPALQQAATRVFGPAGTGVMEDTFGLHRGLLPKVPRLLFWARYGLHANKTYMSDGQALGGVDPAALKGRIDLDDDYHAYVNRLLLRQDRG
jgi:hypothetical protein